MIKKILKLFSWVIVGLIFYFLFKNLWENWTQVKEYQFQLKIPYLLISFFLYFLAMLILSQIWRFILEKKGHLTPRWEIFRIYFLSNFGKYLPGKVWLFLIRLKLGQSLGLPKKLILVSSILEMGLGLIVPALFSLIFLAYSFWSSQYFFIVLLFLIIVGFVIFYPKILYSFFNLILRTIRKEEIPNHLQLNSHHLLIILSLSLVIWIFWGLSFYFFTQSFVLIPLKNVLEVIGIFALSYLSGFLALFAPNGLAVREGVQAYFLSFFLPLEIAILISLAYRIWITFNELFIALLVSLNKKST